MVYIDETLNESINGQVDTYEIEHSLEWVLNRIDKDLKEIVILYYYDELSVADIAEILQIPAGTVKSRLSRARTQIGAIIEKEEGEFNG